MPFCLINTNKYISSLWFIQYTCMRCQITCCVSVGVCAGLFGDVLTCGLRGEGSRDWLSRFKVWSKEEPYDYIGIDWFFFFLPILYLYTFILEEYKDQESIIYKALVFYFFMFVFYFIFYVRVLLYFLCSYFILFL